MVLAHRVALNGTQLDSLDNRILINSIDEAAGKDTISAVSRGAGDGQRITNQHRDSLDITIKFSLNIKRNDMAGRTTLLNTINKWANGGGVLTVGHRSGQRLVVVLAQAPGGGDQFNWANEFTMVFRAYGVPFWEDATETVVDEEGSSGSSTISVPGSTESVAEVTVENDSGNTLTDISLTINGHQMTFTGLSISSNGKLIIDHIHTGGLYCLRARVGSTSVLAKHTGADEFVVAPGTNNWSFTTNVLTTVTVSVKGRYL